MPTATDCVGEQSWEGWLRPKYPCEAAFGVLELQPGFNRVDLTSIELLVETRSSYSVVSLVLIESVGMSFVVVTVGTGLTRCWAVLAVSAGRGHRRPRRWRPARLRQSVETFA